MKAFLHIFTHLEFDACNTFQKKLGLGKLRNAQKNMKHCTGEQVNWKQVKVMILYKRSIPERIS